MGTKLSLTCTCGETMVVPDSVLGKRGLCPHCGNEVLITSRNTAPYQPRVTPNTNSSGLLERWNRRKQNDMQEEACRKFAEAVDLYNEQRYAESLAILGVLRDQFPGNPHVLKAEAECRRAMEQSKAPFGANGTTDTELTPELVHKVILDKMLHGATESVQLEAAMLAARLMGMLPENGSTLKQLPDATTSRLSQMLSHHNRDEIP